MILYLNYISLFDSFGGLGNRIYFVVFLHDFPLSFRSFIAHFPHLLLSLLFPPQHDELIGCVSLAAQINVQDDQID